MYIENILIEGAGCGDAYGNINNREIDISCSDEDLLNQRYFFTIYKTDDELNKQEQIGKSRDDIHGCIYGRRNGVWCI